VEGLIALAIGSVVLVAVFQLMSGGSRLVDSARREAVSQSELQLFVETLNTDVEELLYIGGPETFEASPASEGAYRFAVGSKRFEPGIPPVAEPVVRRVEYSFKPVAGKTCDVVRTVQQVGGSGKLDDVTGPPSTRTVARGLTRVKIVPMIWAQTQTPPKALKLAAATDALARTPGAAPACLSLTVTIGEVAATRQQAEALPSIAVRLWCRNRLLALGREGRL
jgi:hypothetical protein